MTPSPVAKQYERFPYPPIPTLALPRRGEGEAIRFELGTLLAYGSARDHRGIRILVAGAGTFEALVVAQAHPRAREIVAVDISNASLEATRRRLWLHRLARPFTRLAPVTLRRADLRQLIDPRPFDYIIASNVLHHVDDPAGLLARLAGLLKPEGIFRMVTYPKASRLWMRETSRWLRGKGITPETPRLRARAKEAIASLPEDHPVRSTYQTQGETRTASGIVDAFLNACEKPLSPLEWRKAAANAGLILAAETQAETSRSSFLEEILPKTRTLDAWSKLQILDDFQELCANPVLWLKPGRAEPVTEVPLPSERAPISPLQELAQGLKRAEALLAQAGITLEEAFETFKREVGPRVSAPPEQKPLPGLAATDYELKALLRELDVEA